MQMVRIESLGEIVMNVQARYYLCLPQSHRLESLKVKLCILSTCQITFFSRCLLQFAVTISTFDAFLIKGHSFTRGLA